MKLSQTRIPPASSAERYRVLLEVGHSLSGTVESEEELYAAIYREAARVMPMDGFYVSLYDEEQDLATVVFWADRGRGRQASVSYTGSDCEVIRTGKPVLVKDYLERRSLLVVGDEGDLQVTRSAVSAPLRSRGRLMGVISAQSYDPDTYSSRNLTLLQGIADVSAVALENVRHVQELRRRRAEAERMEELGRVLASSLDADAVLNRVVEAAADLLSGDGAVVWLVDDDVVRVGAARGGVAPHVGTEIPLEDDVVRRLARDRRPMVVDRSEFPPELRCPPRARSALVVPLQNPERVIGALSVIVTREGGFEPEHTRLLQRLSGHAAVALENARLHSALQTLSLTDPLTGLANRRQLEVHLAREFAAARRGRPLSVVLFDVDRFKEFNDEAGHVAGDQALRAIARVLTEETRAMNLAARYGGDEFLAVLSDTGDEGARQHAGRIHAGVARDPDLRSMGITLSSGMATFNPEMQRIEDLIRAADEDMYRSKARTRSKS
jgi:diguanylate cyclase (GGDEF)-like protein